MGKNGLYGVFFRVFRFLKVVSSELIFEIDYFIMGIKSDGISISAEVFVFANTVVNSNFNT